MQVWSTHSERSFAIKQNPQEDLPTHQSQAYTIR
jgi:hypothetical protein